MLEFFTLKELLMFAFAVGAFVVETRGLRREFKKDIELLKEKIEDLKVKTDETNRVKERLIITEEQLKAAWLRIDELRGFKDRL